MNFSSVDFDFSSKTNSARAVSQLAEATPNLTHISIQVKQSLFSVLKEPNIEQLKLNVLHDPTSPGGPRLRAFPQRRRGCCLGGGDFAGFSEAVSRENPNMLAILIVCSCYQAVFWL